MVRVHYDSKTERIEVLEFKTVYPYNRYKNQTTIWRWYITIVVDIKKTKWDINKIIEKFPLTYWSNRLDTLWDIIDLQWLVDHLIEIGYAKDEFRLVWPSNKDFVTVHTFELYAEWRASMSETPRPFKW